MHILKEKTIESLLKKVELHDEREINFFIKNIDDKSIFFDCGANQGFYTIPVAASNKNCKIIASSLQFKKWII